MYFSHRDFTRDQSIASRMVVLNHLSTRSHELLGDMVLKATHAENFPGTEVNIDLQSVQANELWELLSSMSTLASELRIACDSLVTTYNEAFDEALAERRKAESEAEDRELESKLGTIPDEDYDIRPRRELSSDGSY